MPNNADILIVVAHPDDESLWFGEGIHQLVARGKNIIVLCLSGGSNPIRSAEFKKACLRLKVKGKMLNNPDRGVPRLQTSPSDLDLVDWHPEYVITHAPWGNERHHPHHQQCFQISRSWALKGGIPFGYFSEKKPLILNPLIETIEFSVNRPRKNALLSIYDSEISGLRDYEAYHHDKEYLIIERKYFSRISKIFTRLCQTLSSIFESRGPRT